MGLNSLPSPPRSFPHSSSNRYSPPYIDSTPLPLLQNGDARNEQEKTSGYQRSTQEKRMIKHAKKERKKVVKSTPADKQNTNSIPPQARPQKEHPRYLQ